MYINLEKVLYDAHLQYQQPYNNYIAISHNFRMLKCPRFKLKVQNDMSIALYTSFLLDIQRIVDFTCTYE